MNDMQMATLLGARSATERQIRLGTQRTRTGTRNALLSGQKPIQKQQRQRISATTKRTRSYVLQSMLSGRRLIGRSETPSKQEERRRYFAQRQHGQIKTQSQGFTPKQCASKRKPEYESTSIISSRCKAKSFAAYTLNRICKSLMGPKMKVSAISDGWICHSRIENAYRQERLFA